MTARPIHLVVVTNCYPNPYKVYACKFVQRHVEAHRARGVEVTVLTPGDSRQGWRSLWKYVRLLGRVLYMVLFADYDIVHAHWPFPAGLYGYLLSKLRRKPFVVTSHGAFVDNIDELRWPVPAVVRGVLRSADELIVVGREHQQNVIAVTGLPSDAMRLIDMGVWLNPDPQPQAALRHALNLPDTERIIVFIGNLIPRKGVDLLLAAAAQLDAACEPWRLIVGGQGPERERLEAEAERLGLHGRVQFIGAVPHDEVYHWYTAADVCVVPSRREPFGIVPLEAMSCGTAVVAADTGGLAENIRSGKNGLLFPVDDAAALADCLQTILTDDGLRARIAQAGQTTAAQFDTRRKADEVLHVYEQLLA